MFKAFKSLLAGLVAGTVVGVLFAPKKGQELRKEFKKELSKGGLGVETLKGAAAEIGKDIGGTDAYKQAHKELKKHAKTAKGVAMDLMEENIPVHTRKQAKKTFLKAKDLFDRFAAGAKREVGKVVDKVSEKTKNE
ncbi:MAG: YtxH domain-containing protein [Candidatus Gracilibacteria bacterium]|jgi:gas vesicle protein